MSSSSAKVSPDSLRLHPMNSNNHTAANVGIQSPSYKLPGSSGTTSKILQSIEETRPGIIDSGVNELVPQSSRRPLYNLEGERPLLESQSQLQPDLQPITSSIKPEVLDLTSSNCTSTTASSESRKEFYKSNIMEVIPSATESDPNSNKHNNNTSEVQQLIGSPRNQYAIPSSPRNNIPLPKLQSQHQQQIQHKLQQHQHQHQHQLQLQQQEQQLQEQQKHYQQQQQQQHLQKQSQIPQNRNYNNLNQRRNSPDISTINQNNNINRSVPNGISLYHERNHPNRNRTSQSSPVLSPNSLSKSLNETLLATTPPQRARSPFKEATFVKQIKEQRRPMYTPAVLRSDESHPTTSSPVVPIPIPISSSASINEDYRNALERPRLASSASSASIRSTNSFIDYWGYLSGSLNSNKFIPDEPSKKHWKSDNTRFSCTGCNKLFHYLTETRRKHHCRYCGDIFCSDCLRNFIYLNKNAEFTLFGDDNESDENITNGNGISLKQSVTVNTNKGNLAGETEHDGSLSQSPSNIPDQAVLQDKKYLCKVCQACALKYEKFVRKHNTMMNERERLKNEQMEQEVKNNNNKLVTESTRGRFNSVFGPDIPIENGADWDWSTF